MRILLTVHQFFPMFRAGTEVLTLSVAKELIRRGHEVRVFTGHPADPSLAEHQRFDEYEYEGIHIYRFHHAYTPMCDQNSMIEVGYNNKLAVKCLKNIVGDFLPDLVHHFHLNRLGVGVINYLADKHIAQYFTPTDFWMICPTAQLMLPNGTFCYGPNKFSGNCVKHFAQTTISSAISPLINVIPDNIYGHIANITKNSKFIIYPKSNEVKAMAMRLNMTVNALNRLQGILAPNRFMYDLFCRYGISQDLLHQINFGVDIVQYSASKEIKSYNPDHPLRLGFIGTLAPHKGCHIAIKAMNLLSGNNVNLKIYGNGQDFPAYLEELTSLAKDNDQISFCGTFPNDEINQVLNEFDALLVPSVWFENTPLVIYSAQAAGCPVIGSDLPGISAVINHQYNGLLFEAGNEKELAKKIEQLKNMDLSIFSKNAIMPKSSGQYVDDLYVIWNI